MTLEVAAESSQLSGVARWHIGALVTTEHESWGVLRSILKEEFSFADIKVIAGLAGVDPTTLAHLEQKSGTGGATKSQLLSAIDQELGRMDESRRQRFHRIASAEAVKRKPIVEAKLHDAFERLDESSRLERNGQPFAPRAANPMRQTILNFVAHHVTEHGNNITGRRISRVLKYSGSDADPIPA